MSFVNETLERQVGFRHLEFFRLTLAFATCKRLITAFSRGTQGRLQKGKFFINRVNLKTNQQINQTMITIPDICHINGNLTKMRLISHKQTAELR